MAFNPYRYRVEKLGHVAGLGLAGFALGLEQLLALLAAGLAYWLVSVGLVLRARQRLRWDDKARDLGLALTPVVLCWHPLAGLCLLAVALLVPIRD